MSRDDEPAHVLRARLRAECSHAYREAAYHAGTNLDEPAEAAGSKGYWGRRWANPREEATPDLPDIVVMHREQPEVARVLLSWAAQQMGLELADREATHDDYHLHLIETQHESAEAVAADLEAIRDGDWTTAEHERSAREHREAAHAHQQAAIAHEGEATRQRAEVKDAAEQSRRRRMGAV